MSDNAKKKPEFLAYIPIILILALGIWVTGRASNTNDMATTNPDVQVDIQMKMGNYFFEPNIINASPGETVSIELDTLEGIHNLAIEEEQLQYLSRTYSAGEKEVIEFTIPEDMPEGSYEFYCAIGNHRQLGMVGTLNIAASN